MPKNPSQTLAALGLGLITTFTPVAAAQAQDNAQQNAGISQNMSENASTWARNNRDGVGVVITSGTNPSISVQVLEDIFTYALEEKFQLNSQVWHEVVPGGDGIAITFYYRDFVTDPTSLTDIDYIKSDMRRIAQFMKLEDNFKLGHNPHNPQ